MNSSGLKELAENLWVLDFPLKLLGTAIGRRSTVIRLGDRSMLIHSTAPFEPEDVRAIGALGPVKFILDATLFHDSFARDGVAAFPKARFFAPPGFEDRVKQDVASLAAPPPEWAADLDLQPIEGMPSVNEYAFFHKPSRTLIVADLVFNISSDADAWTALFFRFIAGTFGRVRMGRLFKAAIRDRSAFHRSMERILNWNFDRLIMGHGEIVDSGGNELLRQAVAEVFKAA